MVAAIIQNLWRVGNKTTADYLKDKLYEGFLIKSPEPQQNKRITIDWTNIKSCETQCFTEVQGQQRETERTQDRQNEV